jgi:hypothetical protein
MVRLCPEGAKFCYLLNLIICGAVPLLECPNQLRLADAANGRLHKFCDVLVVDHDAICRLYNVWVEQ